jgi:uncharacterized membrane protein
MTIAYPAQFPVNGKPTTWTQLTGINSRGQIVGYYYDGGDFHGFLYQAGEFSLINASPGNASTNAFGISDSGQIVGEDLTTASDQGFVDNGGAFTPIAVPGAAGRQPTESVAMARISSGRLARVTWRSPLTGSFTPAECLLKWTPRASSATRSPMV